MSLHGLAREHEQKEQSWGVCERRASPRKNETGYAQEDAGNTDHMCRAAQGRKNGDE